mmetsp:Transcript_8878/g.26038  ORF Transcript_8878/g.26038 Transcript_8878/m.26038 type:complete len:202 (-) Transcript_8878:201-806(-)
MVLVDQGAPAGDWLQAGLGEGLQHGRVHRGDPRRRQRRPAEAHRGRVVLRDRPQAHVPVRGHGQLGDAPVPRRHREGDQRGLCRSPLRGLARQRGRLRLHRGRHGDPLRLALGGSPTRGPAPQEASPAPQVAAEDVARDLPEAEGALLLFRQPRWQPHLSHQVWRIPPQLHSQQPLPGRFSLQGANNIKRGSLTTLGQPPE